MKKKPAEPNVEIIPFSKIKKTYDRTHPRGAGGMLRTLAKAAMRDVDGLGLEASIVAALNFAYQEGYGDGKEDIQLQKFLGLYGDPSGEDYQKALKAYNATHPRAKK